MYVVIIGTVDRAVNSTIVEFEEIVEVTMKFDSHSEKRMRKADGTFVTYGDGSILTARGLTFYQSEEAAEAYLNLLEEIAQMEAQVKKVKEMAGKLNCTPTVADDTYRSSRHRNSHRRDYASQREQPEVLTEINQNA